CDPRGRGSPHAVRRTRGGLPGLRRERMHRRCPRRHRGLPRAPQPRLRAHRLKPRSAPGDAVHCPRTPSLRRFTMNAWLTMILFALASWLPAPASAADYPSQSVRIVVPFAPGGGTDLAARAIAEQLTASLGKPVVVENRPGGNSVIASRIVATAPADGHTLLLTTDIHAINAAYAAPLPYDSLKDFA